MEFGLLEGAVTFTKRREKMESLGDWSAESLLWKRSEQTEDTTIENVVLAVKEGKGKKGMWN